MEPIPMAVWLYLTALPSVCLWCVSTEAPWGLFVFRFVSAISAAANCIDIYRYGFAALFIARHGKCVSASLLQSHVARCISKAVPAAASAPFPVPANVSFNQAFPVRSGTFWGNMSRFIWGIFLSVWEKHCFWVFFSPFPWSQQWNLIHLAQYESPLQFIFFLYTCPAPPHPQTRSSNNNIKT